MRDRKLALSSLVLVACSSGEPSPRVTPAPADLAVATMQRSSAAPPTTTAAPGPTTSAPVAASDPPLRPATLVSLATLGAPPPGLPARPYAALFEIGRRWKLSGTQKHGGSGDDGKPAQSSKRFSTTCEVAELERYVWGLRARTACKDLPQIAAQDLVLGHWFALPDGLYFKRELPSAGAVELVQDDRVFPTPIAATNREERESEDFLSTWRTFEQRGAWCFEQITAAGDEAWHSVCVNEQGGLVSGSFGWAGGSSDEVEFTAR